MLVLILLVIVIVGIISFIRVIDKKQKAPEYKNIESTQIKKFMNISSPDFSQNGTIPKRYTCSGENINPEIMIENVPDGAKSLVLIIDDPDAPYGIWNHWLVWNIDPKTKAILENSIPGGAVSGTNTFGGKGYSGPCPSSGTHRYIFKIYALNAMLDVESGSKKNAVENAMKNHVLDQAELVGLYSR